MDVVAQDDGSILAPCPLSPLAPYAPVGPLPSASPGRPVQPQQWPLSCHPACAPTGWSRRSVNPSQQAHITIAWQFCGFCVAFLLYDAVL